MIPQSNSAARQLSSVPQTHRTSTLRAIADKAHATTARIEFSKTDSHNAGDLLADLPDDVNSRLAHLNNLLHST